MEKLPARWWFVGSSGSGKSTYARAVAKVLGVRYVELDALYHQSGWTSMDTELRSFARASRCCERGVGDRRELLPSR